MGLSFWAARLPTALRTGGQLRMLTSIGEDLQALTGPLRWTRREPLSVL
jgi:hypothetical protein